MSYSQWEFDKMDREFMRLEDLRAARAADKTRLPHRTDLCPSRDHGGHIVNAGRCAFCDAPVML